MGLSILSGSHRELIPTVVQTLRDRGVDAPVVVGGIIPEADVEPLRAAGRRGGLHAQGLRPDADHARHRGPGGGAPRGRLIGVTTGAELGVRLRDGDLTAAPAVLNLVETRDAHERGGGAAARGLPRRPGRRGARPRRRDHRAARRGQVDAAGRARARVAGRRAQRRGARRRPLVAALGRRRCWATARGSPSIRPTHGVFIRSTAAAGRLGGLAPATRAAAHALAAAFDVVVVETVGVGQSETDVAEVADTVAVIVQPGSGDVLQFLKAGIMEIPDVLVVTKADLGDGRPARAARPARGPALARRSRDRGGGDLLDRAGERHRRAGGRARRPPRAPRPAGAAAGGAARQRAGRLRAEHGERGLRALGGRRAAERARWPTPTPAPTCRPSSPPSKVRRPARDPRRDPGDARPARRLRGRHRDRLRCWAPPTSAPRRPSGRSPSPPRSCGSLLKR